MNDIGRSNELIVNNKNLKTHQNNQNNLCQILMDARISDFPFAECEHLWGCRKCSQKYMLACIQKNQYPKCFRQECGAKMRIDSRSLYQYFTKIAKDAFQQFQRNSQNTISGVLNRSSQRRIPCKYPDCPGYLINNKCTKCLREICENCKQPSHSLLQVCNKNLSQIPQGVKSCPFCNQYYVRDEGCHHITCRKCKNQFCQFCKNKWSILHHSCKESFNQINQSQKQNSNNKNKQAKKTKSFWCLCQNGCSVM